MNYKEVTLEIAELRAEKLKEKFLEEVKRLLISGALDLENHNR
jgi:hypothetical protein